jgi:hypothetical protein
LASREGVGNAGDEYRWLRHIGIAAPNGHGQIDFWSPKDSRRANGAAKNSRLSQRRLSSRLMNVKSRPGLSTGAHRQAHRVAEPDVGSALMFNVPVRETNMSARTLLYVQDKRANA